MCYGCIIRSQGDRSTDRARDRGVKGAHGVDDGAVGDNLDARLEREVHWDVGGAGVDASSIRIAARAAASVAGGTGALRQRWIRYGQGQGR